jgi:hypothetical protein
MGMPRSCPFPWLPKVDRLFIGPTLFQDILWCVPCAVLNIAEIPRMAFSARKIAARLIDGEIIFRPGQVDGCDKPMPLAFLPLECILACQPAPVIDPHPAVSRMEALLSEMTYSLITFPQSLPPMAMNREALRSFE